MELRTDIHHLNWTRADWNKRRYSKLIRDHELSKEKMVIGVHRELHRYVEPVAPPNLEIGRYVLSRLNEMPSFWVPLDAAKALRDELVDDAPELSKHYDKQIPFLELSRKALKQTIV